MFEFESGGGSSPTLGLLQTFGGGGGFTAGPDSTKNSTDSWTSSSKLRQPSSVGHRPRLANSASQHMGSIKGSWEEDLKDTHAGRDFLLPF
jgi:hypothetical protein